ncbi:HipA domain-containing protein [Hymenobacter sp.]|uniref:HipA domain-containing protein n=1 Tax=Hymenobacter sp. TaxID=1898978 RepID=UPI00286BB54F|nr:HipA domain-containing protein [Hymenobacter sp.]
MQEKLLTIRPFNTSRYRRFRPGAIPTLKQHQYQVQSGYTITGEAPKQFLRVYEHEPNGTCRKANPRTWPLYIAKTAKKWYPTESILEYALNQLGQCWELRMAQSRLVWAGGQVRFLSRYFLHRKDSELVHGADILADYLNDHDRTLVTEIEQRGWERELVTVQLFSTALRSVFPAHYAELLADFVRMLLFDALVGNYDRHFYNYGVVRDLTGRRKPCFSPIYDTARGLFWNQPEARLVALHRKPREAEAFLQKYVGKSQAKIGWEGEANITHFDLVRLLVNTETGLSKAEITAFFHPHRLTASLQLLDARFGDLLSPERLDFMKRCLQARFTTILSIL